MRAVLLALLLLAPSALASHPVEMDPASLARAGAEIVLFVDVNGAVHGKATIAERDEDFERDHESVWKATYSWSATAFLVAREAPDAEGWTHEGRAWANNTLSFDERNSGVNRHSVGEEYEWHTTNEGTCTGAGVERAYPRILARLDDAGKLRVRLEGMQSRSPGTIRFECRSSDTDEDGTRTEHQRVGPSVLLTAPVLHEPVARGAGPSHLELELDLLQGKQTFVDAYEGNGSPPGVRDREFAYCDHETSDPEWTRHCSAFGSVEATLFVDPCEVVRKSHDKHLAELQAMKAPAKGSSESQVRAFQVALRPKMQAFLQDARALDLHCGGGSASLGAAADAARALADAWFDVARTHGLSNEGIRDALAAERTAQLAGNEGANSLADLDASVARNGAPAPSGATASVKVHSPVALHAWDEEGRHVGWNATSGAADLDVPNATYEGRAGEAQVLTLPAGVYRVAADELAPGTYALNISGSILPLRSAAGGGSTVLLVVDDAGALPLAAARGALAPGFLAASEMKSTQAPAGADGGSPASSGEPAGRGIPLGAWVALVALAVALARPRRA